MNLFTDSSSDDSDFEDQELQKRPYKKRKIIEYRTPAVIKERFRLTAHQIEILLQKVGARLGPKASTNNALNAKEKLLIGLRFYAANDFYYSLGDSEGKKCIKIFKKASLTKGH